MEDNPQENKLIIPDAAYNIPLREFLEWYDAVLNKSWLLMSEEQRIKYFKDIDLEQVKSEVIHGLKKESMQDIPMADINRQLKEKPADKILINKAYYRLIEFQKLENDMELLQAMVRKFMSKKAVDKMSRMSSSGSMRYYLNLKY
jgi:hypothetical protein